MKVVDFRENPYASNFARSKKWFSTSNALDKSKKTNPILYPLSEKCFHFSSTFIKSVAYSDFYQSLQEV